MSERLNFSTARDAGFLISRIPMDTHHPAMQEAEALRTQEPKPAEQVKQPAPVAQPDPFYERNNYALRMQIRAGGRDYAF